MSVVSVLCEIKPHYFTGPSSFLAIACHFEEMRVFIKLTL